jgi:hypothetical protein
VNYAMVVYINCLGREIYYTLSIGTTDSAYAVFICMEIIATLKEIDQQKNRDTNPCAGCQANLDIDRLQGVTSSDRKCDGRLHDNPVDR